MSTKQKRFILPEDEIPKYWYNIQADMKTKPMPPLNPKTKEALKPEDLYPIFAKELCKQELNQTDAWIEIPEAVREMYKYYRSTPLVRAYGLEKALGTPAHIYFKNESVSPIGSHKLNSALAQAYYCKEEGVTNVTTETGAGQWGAALSYAAKVFGLEAAVYQVKISYNQKPYRRSIMQTFGATVTASPSMSTRAGKDIITRNPNYQGSLGTAISEAIELAMSTPNCKYTLGSVLSHVTLHQTVIGLEAEKQMEMAGEYPDMIIGCFGGGSNFGGICFPFMRHTILNGKQTRYIAAEPASCPKLTRGKFQYDFGDEAGYTPLLPMFTLGHNFSPANIHAGGLRYHGAGVIVSQLLKDNLGTAISEAIELAMSTPNCKYTLGSVLSHVTLHQTVIGLEAEKQMEMAGEYPDMIIGCFGGGSNFGGICFPFMRHTILNGKQTRYIAAEPASCPKLTRGKFQYDFGDEAGYTPLLPMFTLGHNFSPANIHAGGLRYHGAGVIVSQLLKDNLMEAVDIQQLESFQAGCLFAQAEGIIPAPESCHAIAAAVREANKCKESGEEKVILFNLSGHGLIDMASYDQYLAGNLMNYELKDEDIQKNLDEIKDM